MLIDNSEFKNAELSYRRGYQQGAYDALQLALTGADSDEIRKWVEIDIYQWRLEGMTKPTKPAFLLPVADDSSEGFDVVESGAFRTAPDYLP